MSKPRGGTYCVAGGPGNVSCRNGAHTAGVSMHRIPLESDKKRKHIRAQWIRFVQKHRPNWQPKIPATFLCSIHFSAESFHQSIDFGLTGSSSRMGILDKEAVPTIDVACENTSIDRPQTERERRQVIRTSLAESSGTEEKDTEEQLDIGHAEEAVDDQQPEENIKFVCSKCPNLKEKLKALRSSLSKSKVRNKEKSHEIKRLKLELASSPRQQHSEHHPSQTMEPLEKQTAEPEEPMDESDDDEDEEANVDDTDISISDDEEEKSTDPDWTNLEEDVTEDDDDSDDSDDGDDSDPNEAAKESRTFIHVDEDCSPDKEPKFIVFFSTLLSLFSMCCFQCKQGKPVVRMRTNGTMVTVIQKCKECPSPFIWRSQPYILGKHPAGNILLSFAILMAGSSISKVVLICKHLGLCLYNARTFFYHQKKFLFPTVIHHWKSYSSSFIVSLKSRIELVWCGDGRFDSMGHCAKYGVYTMFCSSINKCVHFELLQTNETEGSSKMELEGVKRSFSFLTNAGVKISTFVSDRHRGVAKWVRTYHPIVSHLYDIWHVARSIIKKMLKISKVKGCEVLKDWTKGVRNHLYWCVMSTNPGFKNLITAKWNSLLRHVSKRHKDHPDPLFTKCAHDEDIERRKWIKVGTSAFDKFQQLVTRPALAQDIRNLSPDHQTSELEGLHSTLNHWHPKMVHFSWLGTYCRHALACLHYNENLRRETKMTKDGKPYTRVTYPKYKLGEEVVREVKVQPTYQYVDDLRRLLFNLPRTDMQKTLNELTSKMPESMTTQFPDRLSKSDAIERQKERKRKVQELYPPGTETSGV